tara:strand:+ start:653 stop:856 length:204 start_codon:yes stop_codon:yes gene_type:complete
MENRQENFICIRCKHFQELAGGCRAFPKGIPNQVLFDNKHNKPLPEQDNNIVFEEGEPLEEILLRNK